MLSRGCRSEICASKWLALLLRVPRQRPLTRCRKYLESVLCPTHLSNRLIQDSVCALTSLTCRGDTYACNKDLIGTVTFNMVYIQTLKALRQPCDFASTASIAPLLRLAVATSTGCFTSKRLLSTDDWFQKLSYFLHSLGSQLSSVRRLLHRSSVTQRFQSA